MTVEVYTKDGDKAGSLELPASVFGIEPNEHAMYQAVRSYLANRRQGTAATKGRAQVRGGGRKPYRQKGTGGARRGSTRSPLLVGGGTIHGPKPHTYSVGLPVKMKRLARKSAYSLRAQENSVVVVEDFKLEAARTKDVVKVLDALNVGNQKVLVLLPEADRMMVLSARNIPNVTTFPADKASTYDVLNHAKLVIFKSALGTLENSFGGNAGGEK